MLDNEIRACDGAFFFGFEPTYVDFLAVQLIHQLNFMLGESTMATMLPASLKLLQRALEARRKVPVCLCRLCPCQIVLCCVLRKDDTVLKL